MYCGQCGTPNNEEAGHCETCGAPLLISAGARTCGQCGASLGDHDRFCTSCGASASNGGSSDVYDAADDFGELDVDDIQIDDLPDWLQGMAPASQQQPQRTSIPDQPSPDDLPDWLRDTSQPAASPGPVPRAPDHEVSGAPSGSGQQVNRDHQPADQFSLVSDDDLPDWLKALSDEDDTDTASPALSGSASPSSGSGTSGNSSRATEPDRSRAVANLYDVPVISRAWHSQGRQVDQTQVTAARQEFLPLDIVAGVSPGEAQSRSIWDAEPVDAEDDQETRPFLVPSDESAAEQSSVSGRGKLIVRIVILALLVIVALLLAFVFFQGV